VSVEHTQDLTPSMLSALEELKGIIQSHYPEASFQVSHSPEEPEIVHLQAIVDVDDQDDVLDLVVDRMMELQIEEDLPIFVIPVRPLESTLQESPSPPAKSKPKKNKKEIAAIEEELRMLLQGRGFLARKDQPLISILIKKDGEEFVLYFADEEAARDTMADIRKGRTQSVLNLFGAWKDIDSEDALDELDRIRHESKPTPPIDLDL